MKFMKRFLFVTLLLGFLGGGLSTLMAAFPGCVTLCDTTTCECYLCCPNGNGTYTCNPTPTPPWCNPL